MLKRLFPAVVFLGGFCHGSAPAESPVGKPNVLFVISDDLDLRGAFGAQSLTPNLDRLRREGVNFSNAHCAVPLCGPSRACLLTGWNAHTTGWYGWGQNPGGKKEWKEWNERPVIRDSTVLPRHFAKNGCDVFGTGKIGHGREHDDWMFTNSDGKIQWGVRPVSQGPWPSDGIDQAMLQRNGQEWLRSAGAPEYMPEPMRKVERWFAPLSHVPNIPPDPSLSDIKAGLRSELEHLLKPKQQIPLSNP